MPRRPLAVLALALALLASNAGAQIKALKFRAVIDGSGHVIPNGIVIVDGDKITRVVTTARSRARERAGHRPDALHGDPGDDRRAHAHDVLLGSRRRAPIPGASRSARRSRRWSSRAPTCCTTLETGVTTVRDLGASNYTRHRAARLHQQGGLDRAANVRRRLWAFSARGRPSAPTPTRRARRAGASTNISQIPEAVKQQVDAGADYIKMYGSTGSGADVTGNETFTYDEMKAAVDAAHIFGKRIAIHSYGPTADATPCAPARRRSSTRSISTMRRSPRWRSDGIFYVPTIDHNRYYAEYNEGFPLHAQQAAALDSFRLSATIATARRAFKAGVKMGMGSDAVFTHVRPEHARARLVRAVRHDAGQALATATTNGAAILGMESRWASIAPGYFADIVAVAGDPMADINVVIEQREVGHERRRGRRRQDALAGARYISGESVPTLRRPRPACPLVQSPAARHPTTRWVGVIMGSKSDLKYMQPAIDLLVELDVPHEAKIVSAHRTPDWMFEYASTAEARGLEVIIAAAGGAAHLPGMVAAKTTASRARRAGSRDDAQRPRFPALDRANAEGRARRHARHRRAWRDQCRAARDGDRVQRSRPDVARTSARLAAEAHG